MPLTFSLITPSNIEKTIIVHININKITAREATTFIREYINLVLDENLYKFPFLHLRYQR